VTKVHFNTVRPQQMSRLSNIKWCTQS